MRYRVHCVIFFWPTCPSFCHSSSFGITTPSSCMMIDAVMYGMIPRKKIATFVIAPPENRSRKPTTPVFSDCFCRSLIALKSMNGTGRWAPTR